VLGRLAALGDRAAFKPHTLPDSLVLGAALVPPVAAGLWLFRLQAAEELAIAVAVGAVAHVLGRLLRWKRVLTPIIPAVIAVAMIGPAAAWPWVVGVAALAAFLELLRGAFVAKAHVQTGVLAYGALFVAGGGALAAYVDPRAHRNFLEPIALWIRFYGGGAAPIDAVRLYVGNVAGPVFATSLLAVAVAAAWFWYARRLSVLVLIAFAVGAVAVPIALRWNVVFQLDSAPLWFTAALVLGERRLLPPRPVQPFLGLAAGLLAVAPRTRGYGVETVFLAVAGLQMLITLAQGIRWVLFDRRHAATQAGRASAPRPRPASPATRRPVTASRVDPARVK
jgi:hypothetical protein